MTDDCSQSLAGVQLGYQLPLTGSMPTMIVMAKDEVLARVERDLTRGHTYVALQRLSSLTVAYPDDLYVRVQRAEVNRSVGNFAEAGRWGFLAEDVPAQDLAAFECAWPKAQSRLAMLKLPAEPAAILGEQAWQRLARLQEAAREEAQASGAATPAAPASSGVGCSILFAVLVLGGLFLFVLGIITVIKAIHC
jgi:hypothetical protein